MPSVNLHDYRLASEHDDVRALERVRADVETRTGGNYGARLIIRKGQGDGPDGAHLLGAYAPYTHPTTTGNLWSGATIEWEDGAVVSPFHLDIPCVFLAEVQPIPTPDGQLDERSGVFKDITFIAPRIEAEQVNKTEADARLRENFGFIVVSGTSGLHISDGRFRGAPGDPIHLGTSFIGSPQRAYHNDNVTIERTHADGVNGMTRNFVSVIDCTTLRVIDCGAENITIATWPGGVDFEPHPHVVKPIIDDVEVRRFTLKKSGGSAISLLIRPQLIGAKPRRFLFEDVWAVESLHGQFLVDGTFDPGPADDILFRGGGSERCTYPGIIRGGRGMRFEGFRHTGGGNVFVGRTEAGSAFDTAFIAGDFGGSPVNIIGWQRGGIFGCANFTVNRSGPFPIDATIEPPVAAPAGPSAPEPGPGPVDPAPAPSPPPAGDDGGKGGCFGLIAALAVPATALGALLLR